MNKAIIPDQENRQIKPDRFEHYRKLLADIERLATPLLARFPHQITCHLGCVGCCQQHLSLSTVEAEFVAAAARQLPEDVKARVRAAARALAEGSALTETCPLLDGDGCSIYQSRPIICRTHGFPITFQDEETGDTYLDVCPLNFSQAGELAQLRAADTINIDRVNLRLAAINFAYCRDEKGDAAGAHNRVALAEIILSTLQE
jgi:Fe-S-cluster containining protein